MSSSRAPLGVFLVAVALLVLGIVGEAWPFLADDAFISLRFAERLVAGHCLTWTDGERVEGYSNLLWILLTALLHVLGCDWIVACRVLGIGCTTATFAVLAFGRLMPGGLPAGLAIAVLAAQASTAAWAIGGLEAPLALLLVSVAMVGLDRGLAAVEPRSMRRWLGVSGVGLALLAWTRPDGPLWAAVAATTVVCTFLGKARPRSKRLLTIQLAMLMGPVTVAVAMQLGFRLAYYGEWLPNTAHVKVSSFAESFPVGLDYLWSAATSLRSILLPALLGLALGARQRESRAMWLFAILSATAWSLYLLRVGGDVFPRNRMVLPLLAPLTTLAALGVTCLSRAGRAGNAAAWTLALACIGLARHDASNPGDDVRQQLSRWEWTGVATGEWLGRAFAQQQPLLAVDAAGAVPFSSKLPCLDMLGLCDKTIASTPPPIDQAFIAGHNRGNGAYVLSRQPDLVLFWLPPGNPQPRWLSGAQMEADSRFLADYRIVLFQTGELRLGDGSSQDLRITAWVRVEGRAGATRRDARIAVPGYLLGSYRQSRPFRLFTKPLRPEEPGYAEVMQEVVLGGTWWKDANVQGVLDTTRGLAIGEVRRPGTYSLPHLPMAAGAWTVQAEGLPAGVTLSLIDANSQPWPRRGDGWRVTAADGSTAMVAVVCSVPESTGVPFSILEFVLQRSD